MKVRGAMTNFYSCTIEAALIHLDLRYDFFPDFNFDDLEDDECLSEFRFRKRDLPFLTEL